MPTYHKLVKTTPKPNATKNSSGELVGPPGEEWCCVCVGWWPLPVAVAVVCGMLCDGQVRCGDSSIKRYAESSRSRGIRECGWRLMLCGSGLVRTAC